MDFGRLLGSNFFYSYIKDINHCPPEFGFCYLHYCVILHHLTDLTHNTQPQPLSHSMPILVSLESVNWGVLYPPVSPVMRTMHPPLSPSTRAPTSAVRDLWLLVMEGVLPMGVGRAGRAGRAGKEGVFSLSLSLALSLPPVAGL